MTDVEALVAKIDGGREIHLVTGHAGHPCCLQGELIDVHTDP